MQKPSNEKGVAGGGAKRKPKARGTNKNKEKLNNRERLGLRKCSLIRQRHREEQRKERSEKCILPDGKFQVRDVLGRY